MVRMSIRDIRLHWPEAEKRLAAAGEVIVTRDSVPVARLLPYTAPPAPPRGRFQAAAQKRWLREFWKDSDPQVSTDELLRRDRSE